MPRLRVIGGLYARIDLLNVVYGPCSLLSEHGQKSSHYTCDNERVI